MGDLLSADQPAASRKLLEVYGNIVHQNNSLHLVGGIANGHIWQERHHHLLMVLTRRCYLPSDGVGKRFLKILAAELRSVRA